MIVMKKQAFTLKLFEMYLPYHSCLDYNIQDSLQEDSVFGQT